MTCSSRLWTETPCQCVSSLDHLVTQWISAVTCSCDKACSSSQLQCFVCSTLPRIEKSQRSRGVCGVGPADSTGKPRSKYCPGGMRPVSSSGWRRPRNPRETNLSTMVLSLPNIFLNLLRQCLVHRLKVDRGLPEENQQRLEIDIELKFNWHRIAAAINRFLQILV